MIYNDVVIMNFSNYRAVSLVIRNYLHLRNLWCCYVAGGSEGELHHRDQLQSSLFCVVQQRRRWRVQWQFEVRQLDGLTILVVLDIHYDVIFDVENKYIGNINVPIIDNLETRRYLYTCIKLGFWSLENSKRTENLMYEARSQELFWGPRCFDDG